MVRQSTRRKNDDTTENCEAVPLWACKLIDKFDLYSSSLERTLSASFDRVFNEIAKLQQTQASILSRLSELENKFACNSSTHADSQNLLYSTTVKIKTDTEKINDKAIRITWVGIGEQRDEATTRKFDQEIVKEVIYTSGDEELVPEFEQGRVSWQRHPPGKPRGVGERGRIIKISLPSQHLRDKLLAHMRTGRQSLTQNFIHSFARRDYTAEELNFDRSLRKQAGDLNAQAGKLAYVVRDFQIIKLKAPRDLPMRTLPPPNNSSTKARFSIRASGPSESRYAGSQIELGLSQVSFSQYSPPNSPHPF
ncbi:hypothetical protein ANCDUO_04979 [Ancylostoma duodenale]|uniref:Uncharacterized protein n=1 Tax=Ancylostoma duodenale TaxID=51022 RepID=A0A0C2GTS1_9BILA|nr:hypothetical protein ANCDUO_04979 [Ancylostoma duodenale]